MPSIIERFQPHAVVVDHAVRGDHFAAAVDQPQCFSLPVQFGVFLRGHCTAAEVQAMHPAYPLQVIDIGDVLRQDCYVVELDSRYPILKRLYRS